MHFAKKMNIMHELNADYMRLHANVFFIRIIVFHKYTDLHCYANNINHPLTEANPYTQQSVVVEKVQMYRSIAQSELESFYHVIICEQLESVDRRGQ